MTAYASESSRTWNIGRCTLALPSSSQLTEQTQVIENIRLTLEQAAVGASFDSVLRQRNEELSKQVGSPIVAKYRWSPDMGGTLYVLYKSDPSYYELEAHRWIQGQKLTAVTSADKQYTDDMITDVRQTLANYQPGDTETASFDKFAMRGGSLHQKFRNSEEAYAEFTLPNTGTRLEFDSKVIARPVQMDLFEREAGAVAEAKESGLFINVLRKKHRTVASQDGVELVDTGVSRQQRQYAAYFETPGVPNSPSQTHLVIRFYTEDILPNPPDEKQFLALWDSILDSLKVAP